MLKDNNGFSDFHQKIYNFIISYTGIELSCESIGEISLVHLRLDSLSLVELQMQLEDNFGLTFSLDNLSSDTSLKQLVLSLKPIDA
jgi:acyl carrier protein